jgi:glycosyltransferase involved in cell wall biosynthesis
MMLSIIIPVYNEENTLATLLKRVEGVTLDKEILVVDDGSTDSTYEILRQFESKPEFSVFCHERNFGKGHAIRTALEKARGDFVVIQDADLEYDPQDLLLMIGPLLNGSTKVVYGSRRMNNQNNEKYSIFCIGGIIVTYLARFLYGLKITDEATCYKMFDMNLLKSLQLTSERFEFCPEVTAKLAKRKIQIVEVPISYSPRSKSEGKKIGWYDAIEAIWTLLKFKVRD